MISFQNGVSNVDLLKEALPKATVLRGTVPFNVATLGNGRWHKGVAGTLMAEDHEVTRALAERIGNRPGRLKLSDAMIAVAWGKLLINLNNAVNALSGKTLLEELGDRNYRRVFAAAQIEALEILKAAGIEPAAGGPIPPKLMPHVIGAPDFIFRSMVLKRQKIDANARSSMADDFAAKRTTEIDYLNGEVVKLARKLGMKAPVNEAILVLVKQAEAGVRTAMELGRPARLCPRAPHRRSRANKGTTSPSEVRSMSGKCVCPMVAPWSLEPSVVAFPASKVAPTYRPAAELPISSRPARTPPRPSGRASVLFAA